MTGGRLEAEEGGESRHDEAMEGQGQSSWIRLEEGRARCIPGLFFIVDEAILRRHCGDWKTG